MLLTADKQPVEAFSESDNSANNQISETSEDSSDVSEIQDKLLEDKKLLFYLEVLMNSFKTIDIDLIIIYFILVSLFLYDSIIEVVNLLLFNKIKKKNNSNQHINNSRVISVLKNKTDVELKALLEDVDLISNLSKEDMINIILNTPNAMQSLKLQERKLKLNKMKNQDLRDLLKGVDKVSRMKKSELVDMVISIENLK
tara:strand:+ start:716 stop:1312 length:597 start_codon:yes stop_codon:yes gene_type:complete